MDSYIPVQHWQHKSRFYLKDFSLRRDILYQYMLRRLITKQIKKYNPQGLLEIGCGPGRLFPCYTTVDRVVCVDFADGMLKRAQQNNQYGYELFLMDAEKLRFEDKSFGMVITSNMLLHVPPSIIKKVVSEICRVSTMVACVELDESCVSDFCFFHNYKELFAENGFSLVEKISLWFQPDQSLFVFCCERGDIC